MKKIFGLLVALMASVSMFAKTYQQDIVSAYDTVVFDWANNIGSISYEGNVTETTVKTQMGTIVSDCIAFNRAYYNSIEMSYTYAELSIAGGFKAGDVVSIDYCLNNSDNIKVATVALFNTADSLLIESENGINAREQNGTSTLQYELTEDMSAIRVARGSRATTRTCITRLQVIRTEPTYNVIANAIPSYAGTVDVTYNAEHTQATMTATANDGYYFTSWNDGNTQNPRTINLTQDVTYTAYFAQQTEITITVGEAVAIAMSLPQNERTAYNCKITGYVDSIVTPYDELYKNISFFMTDDMSNLRYDFEVYRGKISAEDAVRCVVGSKVTVTGKLNHFYSNSKSLEMAELANGGTVVVEMTPVVDYTVTTNAYPLDAGTVQVSYNSNHSEATLTAIGSNGYHFVRWNGGNTENPRTVVLTQDTTFMAIFEHDMLEVTYIGMDGKILGVESVPYGSTAHRVGIDADEFGYTLTGWDKDLTHVTENMTVTAIYTRDAVNGFYYIYDKENRTAVLDREGNSYANIRTLNVPNNFIYRGIKFAVVAVGANAFENCDRLTDVVLPGNVENVEEYAFSGCSDMIHLTMSANLRGIADYAFNGCKRLEDITVYAQRVPDLTATSFNAIGNKKYVNVYVPDNRVNNYKRDEYWSEFNIVVKSADAVEGEVSDVTVEPEETTAQFTWPTDNSAGSYTIEITKDGIVFCTLIFNANGQLTGIAFAPGRNGNEAPMAAMTANGGMQFTVTGLDAGTSYAYTVTTKDTQERVIATFEGSFETSGSMEDGIMDVQSGAAPQKVLHNGQIYILRGEKVYTLQGVEVK